jgi:hypothetical protein
MRLLVNGLHDSLYISKTHDKRAETKIDPPVTVEPAHEVKEKDPLKGYEYEKQDRGNDCWSVALASLVNFNLPKEQKKITQTTVRTQTPVFRDQAPGEEKEDYDSAKSGIELFTTKNQGAVSHMGNIFAMSDFISGQVKDTAIRHMVFSTPKCRLDDERNPGKNAMFNVTQALKATIKTALESGQPIAVLKDSHYRVIVSADDSGVKMLNSAGDKAHLDENVKYDDLMKSGGQLELTWLQKDVASLADEFSGLEKKDEKLTAKEKDAVLDPDLVAITSGVVVHKKDTDIPNDVSEYISERVYIPKGLMAEPEVKKEEKPEVKEQPKLEQEVHTEKNEQETEVKKEEEGTKAELTEEEAGFLEDKEIKFVISSINTWGEKLSPREKLYIAVYGPNVNTKKWISKHDKFKPATAEELNGYAKAILQIWREAHKDKKLNEEQQKIVAEGRIPELDVPDEEMDDLDMRTTLDKILDNVKAMETAEKKETEKDAKTD